MRETACPLCQSDPATVVWEDARLRVLVAWVDGVGDVLRVVWRNHVAEMTDLSPADRQHLLDAVLAVEGVLRLLLNPLKINVASLGNQVPHLHWHVIARHADDAFFPDSIWSAPHRTGIARRLDQDALVLALRTHLAGAQTAESVAGGDGPPA